MVFLPKLRSLAWSFLLSASVPVFAANHLTYHNDLASTGVNPSEISITPGSVTVANFSKRFTIAVDGQVYAQPLYKAGVTVTSGPRAGLRNLALVATQHNSVYAIDSDSGAIVWQTSLLALASSGITGATSVTAMPGGDTGSGDITPEIGICSTPVIDPATDFLYVAAKTKQIVSNNTALPHYVYTLYKIDITNGNATANANIVSKTIVGDTAYDGSNYTYRTNSSASASNQDPFVFGSGDGRISINSQFRVYFNAMRALNRVGLTLTGGKIYLSCASHGDGGPYHGWILGYDKTTLALTAALNLTPNGGLGGIWQSGGVLAQDAAGFFYFETGNGTFDGYKNGSVAAGLDAQNFPVNGNYGDCFIKVGPDAASTQASQNKNGWGLKVVDYFSPFNNQALDSVDQDLGSGAPIVLPDAVGSTANPSLLVGSGKEGKIYLINRNNMGKFNVNTDNVVQTQAGALAGGSFGTPAYFNGFIYWGGAGDYGKAYSIANGVMSSNPVKTTPDYFAWPGSTPTICANGVTNGVVWMLDRGSNQVRAYAAGDFSTRVWTSGQAPNSRDQLNPHVKFTVPTVADGKVFVGTTNALVIYGPPQPPTAPPPAPSSLTGVSVSGLQVNLAWADNSSNEDGFKIEQSTDGSTFTEIAITGTNVQAYSAINLQSGTAYYFRVRAFNAYLGQSFSSYSNVVAVQTTSQAPTLSFPNGFAGSTTLLSYNGSAAIVGSRARLTLANNGVQASSIWTKTTQDVRRFSTQFTFQISNAGADGFTFALQNVGNTVVGNGGSGLAYQNIGNSIALKFDIYPSASTIGLYVNGAYPGDDAPASIDVTPDGLDFHSGHVFSVTLTYNGTTLSQTITDTSTNASKTYSYSVNIPSTIGSNSAFVGFTGATGGMTSTQEILTWNYTVLPVNPPTAPSNLVATPASGTQINLTWSDNSTTEDGFKIERKIGAGGSYSQLGVTGANQPASIDTALLPNTTYFYRVRSSNTAGDSSFTAEVSATTPTPPQTPTGAGPVSVSSTQIGMTWNDNSNNEDSYKIFRKTTTASSFSLVATLPPNSTNYTDTSVNPGITYDYHIQSYNLAGFSDFTGFTENTLTIVTFLALDASAQMGTTNTGTFTVSRIGETGTDLHVYYTQNSGSGQAASSRFSLTPTAGLVTIPAGSLTANVNLTPSSDLALLGTQSVTLTVTPSAEYDLSSNVSASVQLLDSPYNAWKISEFGSVAAAQGASGADNANPSGDGIPNLEKYALGLRPSILYSPNSPNLPVVLLDASVGNRLTLSFRRPLPAPPGVKYFIEVTSDLTSSPWATLTLQSGYPINNGDGTETVKATDVQSASTPGSRFIRLRITRP